MITLLALLNLHSLRSEVGKTDVDQASTGICPGNRSYQPVQWYRLEYYTVMEIKVLDGGVNYVFYPLFGTPLPNHILALQRFPTHKNRHPKKAFDQQRPSTFTGVEGKIILVCKGT